jgi:hypothetical protein
MVLYEYQYHHCYWRNHHSHNGRLREIIDVSAAADTAHA